MRLYGIPVDICHDRSGRHLDNFCFYELFRLWNLEMMCGLIDLEIHDAGARIL